MSKDVIFERENTWTAHINKNQHTAKCFERFITVFFQLPEISACLVHSRSHRCVTKSLKLISGPRVMSLGFFFGCESVGNLLSGWVYEAGTALEELCRIRRWLHRENEVDTIAAKYRIQWRSDHLNIFRKIVISFSFTDGVKRSQEPSLPGVEGWVAELTTDWKGWERKLEKYENYKTDTTSPRSP
jgi:hypothetical protein